MRTRGFIKFMMSCLLASLQVCTVLAQEKYRILSVYPENSAIIINNKSLHVNDVFSGPDHIDWKKGQEMWAVSTKDDTPYFFTEAAFRQVEAVSAAQYIAYLSASSRGPVNFLHTLPGTKNPSFFPEKRIAMVIGNSNYSSPLVPSLKTPSSDATAVAEKLRSLGFDVILGYDCVYKDLKPNLQRFYQESTRYDVSLLYYAGHGARYEEKDYILPSDFTPESSYDLEKAIPVREIIAMAGDSYVKTKFIVLDACRDKITFANKRSFSIDDFQIQAPDGQCIIYSTGSNKPAQDITSPSDKYSPFAMAFLDEISKEGQHLGITLENLRTRVWQETNGAQHPVVLNQLTTPFYFKQTPIEGSLSIKTSPSGASIILDGKTLTQMTNVTLSSLSQGTHALSLTLDGYKTYQKEVRIIGGQTTHVDCSLERLPDPVVPATGNTESASTPVGYLSIQTPVRLSELSVDGHKQDSYSGIALAPGDHRVYAYKEGYDPYLNRITIKEGEELNLRIDLHEKFGHRITSYVSGSWSTWQAGIAYVYTQGFSRGISISGGIGILDLHAEISLPDGYDTDSPRKRYSVMENGSIWYPSLAWSVTPAIKLKYAGLGVGFGQLRSSSKPNVIYDFPFLDKSSGKRFDIDEKANIVYCDELSNKNLFTLTPTIYGYIPLGESATELYVGAGYRICPEVRQWNGVVFSIGLRFNSAYN